MTILDIKSGKAMPWSSLQTAAYTLLDAPAEFEEEGHKYEGGTIESVTQILQAEGFIDTRFYNERGRERGSFVHYAIHLDILGELDEETLDPELVPYLEAWRTFIKESGFHVEQTEVPMQSTVYGFAGTPDIIGSWPDGGPARGVVELNNGKYHLIPHTGRTDKDVWLAVLLSHNWKRNHLRR